MAPISSLNEDTLLHIFDAVLAREWSWRPNPTAAPCRQWRELLLTHAHFWARLQCETEDDLKLAPLWLQRSKDAVIDVDISAGFDTNRALLRDVLFMIINNQSRLGKLRLNQADLEEDAQPVAVDDFSNLTDLKVETTLSYRRTVLPYTFLSSQPRQQPIAPKLTKVSIYFSHTATHLQREIRGLLEQCPNLKELSLDLSNCAVVEDDEPDGHVYVFGRLESIDLTGSYRDKNVTDYVRRLLQRSEAPSLLSLSFEFDMDNPFVDAAQQFLMRSNYGRVQKAVLRVSRCGLRLQEKIYRALPGVKELHIDEHQATSYNLLTLGRGTGDLCPLLEYIWVKNSPQKGHEAVVDCLVSRLSQGKRFKAEIRVDHTDDDDRDWIYTHPILKQWINDYDLKYMVWQNEAYEGTKRPFQGPFSDLLQRIAQITGGSST